MLKLGIIFFLTRDLNHTEFQYNESNLSRDKNYFSGKWQLVKKQNLLDPHLNDQLSRGLGRYLLEWVTSFSLLKQGKQLII